MKRICVWCKKPYRSNLMEGSDGMCKRCFRAEMKKLKQGGIMKRMFRAIRRFWSKQIDLEIAYWNRKSEDR